MATVNAGAKSEDIFLDACVTLSTKPSKAISNSIRRVTSVSLNFIPNLSYSSDSCCSVVEG